VRDLAAVRYPHAARQACAPDIVRQFLALMQRAAPGTRADAASALARAYLHCEFDEAVRAEMGLAMTLLLDDPSALVRRALAEALASAANASPHLVLALANDQPEVARIVLAASPVLTEAELADCARVGDVRMQIAIARRARIGRVLAAAIAETCEKPAILALAGNMEADVDEGVVRTILDRFGDDGAMRETLLWRSDLPAQFLAEIAAKTASALADFAAASDWLEPPRAQRIAREAREQTFVAIARAHPSGELADLVSWLRANSALTVALLMRALMSGELGLFRRALADLAEMPDARAAGLIANGRGQGFAALYLKAGLPEAFLPAFRAALDVVAAGPRPASAEISHALTTRLMRGCEARGDADFAPILALLRRFAAESAREDARGFVEDAAVTAPAPLSFAPEDEAAPTLAAIAIEGVNENFALEAHAQGEAPEAIADAA
jgi:uncharacterized protein (DUF2336 family)